MKSSIIPRRGGEAIAVMTVSAADSRAAPGAAARISARLRDRQQMAEACSPDASSGGLDRVFLDCAMMRDRGQRRGIDRRRPHHTEQR